MNLARLLLAACAVLLLLAPVFAEETAPEMSAEQVEMMKRWQAYATPGDEHARLAETAGDWLYFTKVWEQPGAEAQQSEGYARMESVLGGRFLVQHVKGSFMGEPFEGMGLEGYDNLSGKYQTMWVDSMGTGVFQSEGTCDGEICTYSGKVPDVMTGSYKQVKTVSQKVSDDEMVFSMYDTAPDGSEWKTFEIVYKRKK